MSFLSGAAARLALVNTHISSLPTTVPSVNCEGIKPCSDDAILNTVDAAIPLSILTTRLEASHQDHTAALPSSHFFMRSLTPEDAEACTALEIDAFTEPADRASLEKYHYRLAAYPELSLGLFLRAGKSWLGLEADQVTDSQFHSSKVRLARGDEAILIGLCHATPCLGPIQRTSDLEIPCISDQLGVGLQETIAVHTLCIASTLQRHGLGSALLREYLQYLANLMWIRAVKEEAPSLHKVDRDLPEQAMRGSKLAMICHGYLVPFYERFGWVNHGQSKVDFGNGGWYDEVLDLTNIPYRKQNFSLND